jgi:hypothetical protein
MYRLCHCLGVNESAPESSDSMDPIYWGALLCDEVESVLPAWVRRCVESRWNGDIPDVEFNRAVEETTAAVVPRLRALLLADVDDQRGTPLTILRQAIRFPTAVLRHLGASPVDRDPFAVNAFPDDVFNLSPAAWADVDERLAEPGLRWSVAKAFEYKRRHQTPGS